MHARSIYDIEYYFLEINLHSPGYRIGNQKACTCLARLLNGFCDAVEFNAKA
jgi:hypothetical protein